MKKFLSFLLAALFLFGTVFAVSCASAKNDKKEKTGIYAAADNVLYSFARYIPNFEKKAEGVYEEDYGDGYKDVTEYDKNGYLIKETVFLNGKIESEGVCEYDSNGRLIKIASTKNDEADSNVITFNYSVDKNGNITEIKYGGNYIVNYIVLEGEECSYTIDRVAFSYDDSRKITNCTAYKDSGEVFEKYDFSYDEENHTITVICSDSFNVKTTYKNHYDDAWEKLLKKESNSHDDYVRYITEYYESGKEKYSYYFSKEYGGDKTYYNENGKITEQIQLDKDGNKTSSLKCTYNEEGHLISDVRFAASGEPTSMRWFDGSAESSRVIKMARYENGKLAREYEYNEANKIVKENRYSNGKLSGYGIYEYNADGYKTVETEYTPSGKTSHRYEYPGKSNFENAIKSFYYDENGNIYQYSISEYDEKGNRTKFSSYNSDDKLILSEKFEYNENGKQIKEEYVSETASYYRTFEYNEAGNLTFMNHYSGGRLAYRTEYTGTSEYLYQHELRTLWYNSDGEFIYYTINEYDEDGYYIVKESYYTPDGKLYDTRHYSHG